MVCKEEVCKWFKSLNGSTRIEVMCGLLNVLCPIELRFFGSCIENLVNKDYHILNRSECNANDLSYINTLTDIKDKLCRSKIIVALALLRSSNYCCSRPLYRTLRGMKLDDLAELIRDEDVCKEILLMYTMAVYHPAFSFNEKTQLGNFLRDLKKLIRSDGSSLSQKVEHDSCHPHYSPLPSPVHTVSSSVSLVSTKVHSSSVTSSSTVTTVSSAYGTPKCQHQAFSRSRINMASPAIVLLELAEISGKTFRIKVTLNTGKQVEVSKTQQDILSFHTRLLQLFPPEAKVVCPNGYIPQLPGFTGPDKKWEEPVDDFVPKMREYFRQLTTHLPLHLLSSDFVSNFFHPPVKKFSEDGENTAVHSFTVYNSNISGLSDGSPVRNETIQRTACTDLIFMPTAMEERSRHSVSRDSSKATSSSSSLSSSPFGSPPASGANSRSASPGNKNTLMKNFKQNCKNIPMDQFARKVGLEPYKEILQQFTIDELQCKETEDLIRLGMTNKAANKLRELFSNSRPSFISNGVTKHLSGTTNSKKKMPLYQSMRTSAKESIVHNLESSCSDYSSPSTSPPASCNAHSVSSSSDESLHEVGNFAENKNAEKPIPNPAQKEIKGKNNFRRYESKCPVDKVKRYSNALQKPCLQSDINVTDGKERVKAAAPPEPVDAIKRSNQQPKRPNVLPLQCHNNANPKENASILHKVPASILPKEDKSSNSPSPISLNHNSSNANTDSNKLQHNSCPPVGLASPLLNDTNDCKVNAKESSSVNVAETEAATRLHQQVPEGGNTHYHSFVASSIHTNHPHHKGSTLTCVNTMAVNTACQPHSMSSPLMTTTSATQSTLPYACINYLTHMYPPPLPFVPTHTASQPNAFISPTMQAPSPASSFVFPLLPDLAYTNFHIAAPNHNTSHTSSTSPAGLVSFPTNCTYYPGSHFNSLPPSGIQLTGNPVTCFNCGTLGHSGYDCEDAKEEQIKNDQFHLNYVPSSQAVEIRN